jgi:hypothetical protein
VLDNQELAFNTPYWVPNDRTPFTPSPPDQLPANFNQEANTPQGIRNFNIGPDTSTHFTTPGAILTVQRPTDRGAGGNRVADGSLDDALLVDTLPGEEAPVSRHEGAAAKEPTNEVRLPRAYDGLAEVDGDIEADGAPATDLSLVAVPELGREGSGWAERLEPAHLEASVVDRMMADQSVADRARADAAIVQVVSDAPAETEPGAGPVAHALAAGIALSTSVSTEPGQNERRTDIWRLRRTRPVISKGS